MQCYKMAFKKLALINQCRRAYGSIRQGSKYSTTYRQYLKLEDGSVGSYFHDVPIGIQKDKCYVNMVVEVPRWSNGKFEISKELKLNPITQDVKKGKVRFVNNIFPYHGYIHNYGAIPQTWENVTSSSSLPGVKEPLFGDNDPLDCCDIGSTVLKMGDIKTVKVLGSLALVDDGELDWKIMVINTEDPMHEKINNLADVEKYCPGLLDATRYWFKNYKVPTGKPVNEFAFNGEFQDYDKTMKTIEQCHQEWKGLVAGKISTSPNILLPTTERKGTSISVKDDRLPDTPVPDHVNKWYYV
ncbi:probable Inorganic pyrophosphatase, mitochondrial [Nakaseomyces glabratus]|nr:Inorganic pyrophosphatase signature [Nakaseomyces glabratus]QNG14227.1 uncharacterized protein GWK60_H02013 [Nakaseomyces glabratus]SCV15705.1 probable Inorganic pyrophosphatase, mitochondrial [Nakaseomyces glabratus]SLM15120.1 probable Inorganic pyrophosphatase, mitochondrial [Nakaseomyces glabratus]